MKELLFYIKEREEFYGYSVEGRSLYRVYVLWFYLFWVIIIINLIYCDRIVIFLGEL